MKISYDSIHDYLERLKRDKGIEKYEILDLHNGYYDVLITPIKTAEYIEFTTFNSDYIKKMKGLK